MVILKTSSSSSLKNTVLFPTVYGFLCTWRKAECERQQERELSPLRMRLRPSEHTGMYKTLTSFDGFDVLSPSPFSPPFAASDSYRAHVHKSEKVTKQSFSKTIARVERKKSMVPVAYWMWCLRVRVSVLVCVRAHAFIMLAIHKNTVWTLRIVRSRLLSLRKGHRVMP